MATVTLNDIKKSYGAVDIIKGVDLQVEDREFCVFVGPSGCGKSTLLRMIAGLEEITSGELLIDGQRANDVPPSDRGLAMVFQSYALYPHMSVADNMGFSLRLAGVPKAERQAKVGEAARILHLEPLLARKPKELSGGQRQRVAIGRAIVRKPKVFLFDEPLSNLDAALRVQMRIELARLHDELAATMIYVTHDQVEAMTMADKIVVLQAGIVEQAGTPLELYHHPRNLFVAGFIGSPKMNFVPAVVEAVDQAGATVRLQGGGSVAVPVQPGRLKAGNKVTLGVRPEHLRPGDAGELQGEVMVVERLGGETFLYTRLAGEEGGMIVIQADGEIPTRAHERIAVRLDPATCHLFDAEGLAVERAHRHPLADMRRPTAAARKAG
jgi:multiple sugar transport system ATP-binding protein